MSSNEPSDTNGNSPDKSAPPDVIVPLNDEDAKEKEEKIENDEQSEFRTRTISFHSSTMVRPPRRSPLAPPKQSPPVRACAGAQTEADPADGRTGDGVVAAAKSATPVKRAWRDNKTMSTDSNDSSSDGGGPTANKRGRTASSTSSEGQPPMDGIPDDPPPPGAPPASPRVRVCPAPLPSFNNFVEYNAFAESCTSLTPVLGHSFSELAERAREREEEGRLYRRREEEDREDIGEEEEAVADDEGVGSDETTPIGEEEEEREGDVQL